MYINIMNKKQKNAKIRKQNKRNRMINRRYTSTIKTLMKQFKNALESYKNTIDLELKKNLKINLLLTTNKLASFLDKAVKKQVIHKTRAAKKKSTFSKLISTL